MINQKANVEQVQWPNSGCLHTNGAWKLAITGFRSTPATVLWHSQPPQKQAGLSGWPFLCQWQ